MGFVDAQSARLQRMLKMDRARLNRRLREKAHDLLTWRRVVRRAAFGLERYSLSLYDDLYHERPEAGAVNIATKLRRLARGGPFEPYDIALINRAAAGLVGEPQTIFEAGSGTGMFATEVTRRNDGVQITASEFDDATRSWAEAQRAHPNVTYNRAAFEEIDSDAYDLSVALEVIEHIADYPAFLSELARIAPRSIVSTPNKARSAFAMIAPSPAFSHHVREWTSGEFYWVLRVFWDEVTLYTIPDIERHMERLAADPSYEAPVVPSGVHSRELAMIADCRKPRR